MKAIKLNKEIKKNEIDNLIKEGYDLILDFGRKTDPRKIDKILTHLDKNFAIEVSIRHSELEDIVESGLIGGVAGAGCGILASILTGGPIGILVGIGISLGITAGIMSATLNIKIYQYRGHTILKITQ